MTSRPITRTIQDGCYYREFVRQYRAEWCERLERGEVTFPLPQCEQRRLGARGAYRPRQTDLSAMIEGGPGTPFWPLDIFPVMEGSSDESR